MTSTIERVRATRTGRAALEAYIDDAPSSDKLTAKEATLLAIAPDPQEWCDYRVFREDLKTQDVTDIDEVFVTLRRLEDRKLLEVFRELSDTTNMRITIGGWTFYQQWTALRKQITGDNNAQHPMLKPIMDAIRTCGYADIWRSNEHTIGTRIKVSVA